MTEIIVKDIVPYLHIADGEKSNLMTVEILPNLTYPMSVALVLSGEGDETTVMVRVGEVSLSDGNSVLTLLFDPLKYYEGEHLKSFHDKRQDGLMQNHIGSGMSGVYLEATDAPPGNCLAGGSGGGAAP